jgi:hypothetical protein
MTSKQLATSPVSESLLRSKSVIKSRLIDLKGLLGKSNVCILLASQEWRAFVFWYTLYLLMYPEMSVAIFG